MKHAIAIVTALLIASQSALYAADAPQPAGSGAASTTHPGLPDTGQTTHYTQTFGEDADFAGYGPAYLDNGDGTVTDQRTGLIWQKIGGDQAMPWEEALKYCNGLNLAGQSDWRLPNIKELRSISDDHKVQPSLDQVFFRKAQAALYWSSTTECNQPRRAWFVDFDTGLVSYADKPEKLRVLAVRGGGAVPGSRAKPVPDPKLFEKTGKGRGPGGGKKPR
jgi:hypothetical protein